MTAYFTLSKHIMVIVSLVCINIVYKISMACKQKWVARNQLYRYLPSRRYIQHTKKVEQGNMKIWYVCLSTSTNYLCLPGDPMIR